MWAVVVTFLKKWIYNSFTFIVAAMIWMVFSEHNKKDSKLHKHKKKVVGALG